MRALGRWLSQYVLPLGAPGLFLLALIDSGAVPIPQGVDLLLFAQVTRHPGGFLLYAALATVGSLLGCIFLYSVSRLAGDMALARRTSETSVARLQGWFEKYEALTVVLPTMIPLPLPMKLFIIAAGVFRVHFGRFLLAVLFGRVVRFFGIALLAYRYGDQTWAFLRHNLLLVALLAVGLVTGFYWLSRRLR